MPLVIPFKMFEGNYGSFIALTLVLSMVCFVGASVLSVLSLFKREKAKVFAEWTFKLFLFGTLLPFVAGILMMISFVMQIAGFIPVGAFVYILLVIVSIIKVALLNAGLFLLAPIGFADLVINLHWWQESEASEEEEEEEVKSEDPGQQPPTPPDKPQTTDDIKPGGAPKKTGTLTLKKKPRFDF